MAATDMMGWLAAGLTLLAFSLRSIVSLRVAALAANVCFILYGFLANLYPVLALHVLLLPCNACRLWQLSSLRWCEAERMVAAAKPGPKTELPTRAGRDWMILIDHRPVQARRSPDRASLAGIYAKSRLLPARAS